jgi:hypothetical protein
MVDGIGGGEEFVVNASEMSMTDAEVPARTCVGVCVDSAVVEVAASTARELVS